jgi:hypothetical protein
MHNRIPHRSDKFVLQCGTTRRGLDGTQRREAWLGRHEGDLPTTPIPARAVVSAKPGACSLGNTRLTNLEPVGIRGRSLLGKPGREWYYGVLKLGNGGIELGNGGIG